MGRVAPITECPAAESTTCLHQSLARFNQQRLRPRTAQDCWESELRLEFVLRSKELRFIEEQRRALAPILDSVPREADAFMRWFEDLKVSGPGQTDALFPWLAACADMKSMRWFLQQEIAGEAGFDDLVALTQVRFPVRAKLELARTYWDEMGRGQEAGMHGPMLDRVAQELKLHAQIEDTVWESLALANLMSGLATNRRYAYQSIGALGVIEMTAPGRVSQVNAGLARLAVPAPARAYFQLHAGLDVRHSAAWNREVIRPLVESEPKLARAIAEGALLRLQAGARCFERYRRCLITQPIYARSPRASMQSIPQPAPAPQIDVVAAQKLVRNIGSVAEPRHR